VIRALHGLACLALVAWLTACGGKNSGGDDGPTCGATGIACTADTDCCTGNCDDLVGLCARVPGTCGAADSACASGPDCCSFSCVGNRCSGDQCTSDNAACGGDGECCSGICSGGTCAPLNPACKTSGNACGGNAECCSGLCKGGLCNNAPSYCVQTGDTCTTDAECCGGMCAITQGQALGLCIVAPSSGATDCAPAGELCDAGADYTGGALPTCGGSCCSRACFPYGPSGALICQPPSGCRPTGELCTQDSDCCGSAGLPDGNRSNVTCEKVAGNPVGRCNNGNACSPAGAICRLQSIQCNANADCCAGNVLQNDTCHQDSLGIPRCLEAAVDCTDPQATVGHTCATSADCCGLPCVPVGGGAEGFVCGSACVPTGGTCSTTADCCSGSPCVLQPGSTQGTCGDPGTCSDYGQACDATHPCCNGVPCDANGTCTQVIL